MTQIDTVCKEITAMSTRSRRTMISAFGVLGAGLTTRRDMLRGPWNE